MVVQIQCSNCGKIAGFEYTVENVLKKVEEGWGSFGHALYCPKCSETWSKRNKSKQMSVQYNTIRNIDMSCERQMPNTVTEYCANCKEEIEMVWSVKDRGYKAFCPVCGSKLMLCNECMHSGVIFEIGGCDFDFDTGKCNLERLGD